MLSSYRVLDLADDRGAFCGKILADLGADVIKVEPPWGDPARRVGPFVNNEPDVESSLFWQAYASSKRGLTIDLDKSAGQEVLKRLAAKSDFFIESFRPGYLDRLGLGYQDLKEINPTLIYVSVTAFGQQGPYQTYEATDLIGSALGGFMWLTGDDDRPPIRVSSPQFWLLGSAAAASGAMIAHYARLGSGSGQYVDVSCQQSMARTLSQAPWFWDMERTILRRSGPYRPVGEGRKLRINFACADGFVNFILPGGSIAARSMEALTRWMADEEEPSELLAQTNFAEYGFGQWPEAVMEELDHALTRFFEPRTKRYLAEVALERRVLLFPVNDPADIFSYPQLAARGYFREIEDPNGFALRTLGPWVQATRSPLVEPSRAPRLGEHTDQILLSDGLNQREIDKLRSSGVI